MLTTEQCSSEIVTSTSTLVVDLLVDFVKFVLTLLESFVASRMTEILFQVALGLHDFTLLLVYIEDFKLMLLYFNLDD